MGVFLVGEALIIVTCWLWQIIVCDHVMWVGAMKKSELAVVSRVAKSKQSTHAGGRTQNLLIRSQTRCHYATRALPENVSFEFWISSGKKVMYVAW